MTYASGAWEYAWDTKEEVIEYLASLAHRPLDEAGKARMAENAEPRMAQLPDKRWKYAYPSEMYVLGWNPKELHLERLH